MGYLYYNIDSKELGLTFNELRKKYKDKSLSIDIDKIDSWIRYLAVPVPTIVNNQRVEEDIPLFDEVLLEDGTTSYSNGVQRWKIIEDQNSADIISIKKAELKSKVTDKRWSVESGGILFPNGIKIKTSKDDQDRILSVIINAERNGIKSINFKAESGWAEITLVALKQLAKELTTFVQFCFDTEKYHHDNIDALDTIMSLDAYNYDSSWTYVPGNNSSEAVNIYDVTHNDVIILLYTNFIFPSISNGEILVPADRLSDAQSIIDKYHYNVEDLSQNQFYYMLAKSGLDNVIEQLLPPLKNENLQKYSNYKSYLYGSQLYEFSKALSIYNDIKHKILMIDLSLDFSTEELKELWIEASLQ